MGTGSVTQRKGMNRMEFSLILLKKTLVLVLMLLMGFASVKSGRLCTKDSRVISQICFDWVIPLSVVNAFLIDYTEEISREFRMACLFALIVVIACVSISALLGHLLSLTPSEKGSLMFSNSAGMTLPLAQSLMGSRGVLFCAPHMAIQNVLIFTILPYIMTDSRKIDWRKILFNRNFLSILLGFFLFFTQISLPGVIRDTISGVGGIIAPMNMMMIGMLMADVNFGELFRNRSLYLVCAVRLLIYPLAMIAVIAASGILNRAPYFRDILLVLTMCTASPTAVMVTQMATAHRGLKEAADSGSLNVMTTLLCVITIPFMVFLFQQI